MKLFMFSNISISDNTFFDRRKYKKHKNNLFLWKWGKIVKLHSHDDCVHITDINMSNISHKCIKVKNWNKS